MNENSLFSNTDLIAFKKYVLSLPLSGMIASIGILCIQFFRNTPWSIYSLLLNTIPFIFSIVLFGSIIFVWKKKKTYTKMKFSIRRKLIYALLSLSIVFLNIGLYKIKLK